MVTRALADRRRSAGLLLAVSGGPDSMALLHLVADWAAALSARPPLAVATVDHGLRAASRDEAALVAMAAEARGLPHVVLPWTGQKPTTRLQERARDARYALLGSHAEAIGADAILTGHHADDQAETLLMRLGRGSGIAGLAGMRPKSALRPDLMVLRPLLSADKAMLARYCHERDIAFATDPSNADPRFARSRLRAQVDAADALELNSAMLGRLAWRAARAEEALTFAAEQWTASLSPTLSDAVWTADLGAARYAPAEIVQRVLCSAIEEVAASNRHVRLDRLEALADDLLFAWRNGRDLAATLGGTRIALTSGKLAVVREKQRRRGRSSGVRPAVKAELTRRPLRLGKGKGDAYIDDVFAAVCSDSGSV